MYKKELVNNSVNGYDNPVHSIEMAFDCCIEGNVICLAYTKIICYYHLKADNHLQADVLYEQSRF